MKPSEIKACATNPMAFFEAAPIQTGDGLKQFGERMAAPQRQLLVAASPSLLAVTRGRKPPVANFWLEMAKSWGKTLLNALMFIYTLRFARIPVLIQVMAADAEQATEIISAIKTWLRFMPFIAGGIDVQRMRVVCAETGGELQILTADESSNHGSRPSMVLVDELTHIRNWPAVLTALDNATKNPNCVSIYCMNAGFIDSDAWRMREVAFASPLFYTQVVDYPPPWIPQENIDLAAKRNSPERQARLWYGQWSSGDGDYLKRADIQAAITQGGPMRFVTEPGWTFQASLDLGIKKDHSGLVILGVKSGVPRIRVANVTTWKPKPGMEVDLSKVEAEILDSWRRYRFRSLWFDPSQGLYLAQRLRRQGVNCREMTFTGHNLDLMAISLMQAFGDQLIDLYPHDQLISDLGRIVIEEKPPMGHRITAVSDSRGHCDTAIALSIGLPAALQLLNYSQHGSATPSMGHVVSDPKRLGVQLQIVDVATSFGRNRPRRGGNMRVGIPFERR